MQDKHSPHHPLPVSVVKINFQPASMRVPDGYFKDSGQVFGDRGNKFNYGWSCDFTKDTKDRDNAGTRESSLIVPNRQHTCDNSMWNIKVPNSHYVILIGYSDPQHDVETGACAVEGHSASVGWVFPGELKIKTLSVQVSDGKLTLTGSHPSCTGYSFIHIAGYSRMHPLLTHSLTHSLTHRQYCFVTD